MKTSLIILPMLLLVSGCANPRSATNDLALGMSRSEVRDIMGKSPDSSAAIKGRGECDYYSMWRDFWSRRPGDYSDRYYTCYQKGVLVFYGRVGDPV